MTTKTARKTVAKIDTGLDYTAILRAAFEQPAQAERISGCGRVYVCISTPGGLFPSDQQIAEGKAHQAGIKKAAQKLGKIFQARSHYGDRNALYVGYDNASGVELGKGTAIVNYLKAQGITCYRNEHGD